MNSDENKKQPGPPPPHDGQRQLLSLGGRIRVAVCGRRFGKTVCAAITAIRRCEEKGKQRVWWVSPIQDQSDRVERLIAQWVAELEAKRKGEEKAGKKTTLPLTPGPSPSRGEGSDDARPKATWTYRKSEHAITHVNGSRLEFHSAHAADNLRGAGLDLLIVDEAADVDEYVWKMVLRPMLLESKGEALILGTPRGTQNWLHNLFVLGQDAAHADRYRSLRLPSHSNNLLEQNEIEEFRHEMSDDEFRQEFLAEFIDGVDSVFTKINEAVDVHPPLIFGAPGDTYITGIDLGERQDFTVCCSLSASRERLDGFSRFNNIGWDEQIRRIAEHIRRFPGPCVVDCNGVGDPVFSMLQRETRARMVPFRFSNESKENIVRALALGIDQGALKIPKIPQLIAELQSFKRLSDDGFIKRYGAPNGLHDDCVMSLALAWYGLKKLALWGGPGGNPWAGRPMMA